MTRFALKISVVLGLALVSFAVPKHDKVKVWMIGDSTMAQKQPKAFPETGWGMAFGAFFDSCVTIDNRALNGRSTLSFRAENKWQPVLDALGKGDYVIIEFGHNDEKTDKPGTGTSLEEFRDNLARYVTETREKKAIPVLMTPIMRRSFHNGTFQDSHGGYPDVVRSVADSLKVPLIDMHRKSEALIRSLGEEGAKRLFNYVEPGNANYPEGKKDDTHFSPYGAEQMAALAAEGLKEQHIALARHLKKQPDGGGNRR